MHVPLSEHSFLCITYTLKNCIWSKISNNFSWDLQSWPCVLLQYFVYSLSIFRFLSFLLLLISLWPKMGTVWFSFHWCSWRFPSGLSWWLLQVAFRRCAYSFSWMNRSVGWQNITFTCVESTCLTHPSLIKVMLNSPTITADSCVFPWSFISLLHVFCHVADGWLVWELTSYEIFSFFSLDNISSSEVYSI